jgi:cell division protein FtsW
MKKTSRRHVDYFFFGLIIAVLLLGLAMLYSASTVESYKNFGNTSHYFVHQLLYGASLGLLALFICARVNYHWWQKVIPVFLIVALATLVMVKIPGLSFSSGGASRWVHLGPILFQPAELAKLAVIIYLAGWLSRKKKEQKFSVDILPALVIVGLVCLLVLWQPDLGSSLSIGLTALILLFAGGINFKHFLWLIVAGVLGLIAVIKFEPYRVRRLTTFLNRSIDPLGIAYQINQALLAIGGGGLFGYGYGQSRQKYNYLPEAIGDSIFAVIAEELGFFRVTAIIGLFVLLILRGLKISRQAPDQFGTLLALGITGSIAVNVIINIGSIVGLLPLTGIPLPFFSYGSSSLIVTLAGLGIMLNISKHTS